MLGGDASPAPVGLQPWVEKLEIKYPRRSVSWPIYSPLKRPEILKTRAVARMVLGIFA
jgi:hypothetical protein